MSNPVQIIKIIKPAAGQTETFRVSFTGTVKIDFTAIADEKTTLFHDNTNQYSDFFTALVLPALSRKPGCLRRISLLRSSHSIEGWRQGSSCSLPQHWSSLERRGCS